MSRNYLNRGSGRDMAPGAPVVYPHADIVGHTPVGSSRAHALSGPSARTTSAGWNVHDRGGGDSGCEERGDKSSRAAGKVVR